MSGNNGQRHHQQKRGQNGQHGGHNIPVLVKKREDAIRIREHHRKAGTLFEFGMDFPAEFGPALHALRQANNALQDMKVNAGHGRVSPGKYNEAVKQLSMACEQIKQKAHGLVNLAHGRPLNAPVGRNAGRHDRQHNGQGQNAGKGQNNGKGGNGHDKGAPQLGATAKPAATAPVAAAPASGAATPAVAAAKADKKQKKAKKAEKKPVAAKAAAPAASAASG